MKLNLRRSLPLGRWQGIRNGRKDAGNEAGVLAALARLLAWAVIPVALGLVSVQRRDIV
ncbi:MAG: hypothetical protein R3B97_03495 [Dehalococcoidia bacterium]|nr:hypothetical protein [Dehalococcoidia bacterium]MCB9485616.1 hypothetical protein [Thermoflexaceae bacterium]